MNYISLKDLETSINSHGDRNKSLSFDEAIWLMDRIDKNSATFPEMIEDALQQAIGKITTKAITGLLGRPLAQVMSASHAFGNYLTEEELFALHAIEQIGVQGKNLAKRGLWEHDDLFKNAKAVASMYGIEDVLSTALSLIRGRADISATLETPVIQETRSNVVFEDNKVSERKQIEKVDFDFDTL